MKLLLIAFITIMSLSADEIQRIESIVQEITKLRTDYESCETKLNDCSLKSKDEKEKNLILTKELESPNRFYNRETNYKNAILKLEQKIEEQNELLSVKEELNNRLLSENLAYAKEKKLMSEKLLAQRRIEKNEFPKLMMKKEFKDAYENNASIKEKTVVVKERPKERPKESVVAQDDTVVHFKASAFRLNKASVIYSDLNGSVFETWDEGRSFTSAEGTKSMIKITGYFTDKVWGKATKEMWIKSQDATKR